MVSVRFVMVAWLLSAGCATANPTVVDTQHEVTYRGLHRNGIEVFLNIPYGQDTGGASRFKPPKPRVAARGSTIHANAYGPACPQQLGGWVVPISLSNVTKISEDCLNLNVARPKDTCVHDRLPVLVFLHGGSFWTGQNQEVTISPDGMILQSVKNGLPVIHVAMNYRLGFFGFAQSDALKSEGSENAGLRDQRLALEWVRDNIGQFGGDPERITIFGQSSGGLSVGMQIMAFGASKPVPFQQGICESQALEPGITGNFTIDAMRALVEYVGCNSSSLHSKDTVACLRMFDMETLLNASLTTYHSDIVHNIGDIWLPAVDGDFLPSAPSQLIRQGRFANVTTMIGWCEDDVTFFTDPNIKTPSDTLNFISAYAPDMTQDSLHKLLSLYPASDFPAGKSLSSEFYRSARIFRDILMTCQPMWYAKHIAAAGNDVYLYDWNQTILDPILAYTMNQTGFGPIHTSEFAYIFGNLSHYDTNGYPFHPSKSDYKLRDRGSRSWSTFASIGKPSLEGHDTFQGFTPGFRTVNETHVFVIGASHEGLSALDGPHAYPEIANQKLRERCDFINSPMIIEQLRY
ncbi:Carboxylic ester hydrolase [Tolypocladium paradoxum]|uniref:Carboxylic ester hydrolase n=1 Tax=Tolypocladium paradoxum TaxID=94208 RepID=A0A2S4LAS8_9HYPO|nr:Carboxylic ester hydrolase [Tolypocladium paradoxum]